MKCHVLRLTEDELKVLKKILDERVRNRLFFGSRQTDPSESNLLMQVNQLTEKG